MARIERYRGLAWAVLWAAVFAAAEAGSGGLTNRSTRALAVEPAGPPEEPSIAPASNEGQQALAGFKLPAGWQRQLFAAEPLLANPVAFAIDPSGRVFVCETFRQSKGVEDNRGRGYWLNDDLAAETVDDRVAYVKKHLKEKALDFTRHDDRLRLLVDRDGDGQADSATVFAKHFNRISDGTGAGVLFHRGSVYYTCIPDLWRLRDADGDGVAEERQSLHFGYGVRYAFRGHDLHGLIVGPDGKIYFSLGDRGYNVVADGRRWKNPESGAVFRCEADGSQLEVFAYGLRNPQELAFDDHGNLFTGDNNSDSGDQCGGCTSWRAATPAGGCRTSICRTGDRSIAKRFGIRPTPTNRPTWPRPFAISAAAHRDSLSILAPDSARTSTSGSFCATFGAAPAAAAFAPSV